MTSILRVDSIQTAAGGSATASSLGIGGVGKLLQQVTTEISTETSLTTTSFADLTGFTASITPISSSSKIIIIASFLVNFDETGIQQGLKVQLYNVTDSASANIYPIARYKNGGNYFYNWCTPYFSTNSWGTTARSYKLQGAGTDGTNLIKISRTDAFSAPSRGHFIIQEIS